MKVAHPSHHIPTTTNDWEDGPRVTFNLVYHARIFSHHSIRTNRACGYLQATNGVKISTYESPVAC
jgi:hypothetical protein